MVFACGACAPSMPAGDAGGAQEGGVLRSSDASARPLGEARDGIATYYDATGAGNCSFDPSPGDLMVAAMNAPEWNNSAVCGACAEVTGPSGTVTVRIVDRCPECAAGHLDLSREAFERIAPLASGRVSTRWRFVECAPRGPISLKWKDGTNQWWAALQVRDHRLPIERVEVQATGGAFTTLARQSYNYFIGTDLGPGPFTVRVTALGGAQITETNVALGDNTVVAGTQQF
jgi:expansin (peptidoglycan-binding protein)